jgi:hypothetical protein
VKQCGPEKSFFFCGKRSRGRDCKRSIDSILNESGRLTSDTTLPDLAPFILKLKGAFGLEERRGIPRVSVTGRTAKSITRLVSWESRSSDLQDL